MGCAKGRPREDSGDSLDGAGEKLPKHIYVAKSFRLRSGRTSLLDPHRPLASHAAPLPRARPARAPAA
jgi:hypothetical protein